ncbi:hypothetical protein K474DRAFT_1659617 [Panus rudis PR-1116 ss-1]|nr:hypothetical protein K474DRAFT_1659617 [Panus rudis PR-1116 ss-1]
MSPVATPAHPPPGDEELTALYNQVLIGFAEESPTSESSSQRLPSPSVRDREPPQHEEGGDTARSAHPPRSSNSISPKVGLPSSPRSLPSKPTSPTQGRVRPLPPVPPPPQSPSAMPAMPEPRAWVVPPPPPLPADAIPMRSKYTSGDSNRRGLPPTPVDSGGGLSANGNRYGSSPGLPSDPRPASRQGPSVPSRPDTASSYAGTTSSLTPDTPSISMPVPETNGGSSWRVPGPSDYFYNSSVGRQPSYRTTPAPPSASSPPRIPAYDFEEHDVRSPDDLEDMYASPDVSPAVDAPGRSSYGNLLQPGRSFSPAQLSASSYNSYLGRSPSTASRSSAQPQQASVHRNLSATTTGTNTSDVSSLYTDTVNGLGSTVTPPTSLGRGNSVLSYESHDSDGSGWPPADRYQQIPQPDAYHLPQTSIDAGPSHDYYAAAGPSRERWRDNDIIRTLEDIKRPLEEQEDYDDGYDDLYDPSEEGDDRFFNPALLSHIAVRLKDKVPRGTHVKGGIPYPRAFTGRDIVSTIQSIIQRELLITHGISTNDRRAALQVARSLQSQLFFYEVEWGGRMLQDGVEDVYMFLDDLEGASDSKIEQEELPTGVITLLTRCYAALCDDETPCYSYSCPRRRNALPPIPVQEEGVNQETDGWASTVPPELLSTLPQSEVNRQNIIHKVIDKEKQYLKDLDTVESLFMRPLRTANPPIIRPSELDEFMDEVFGNILDIREVNRRLLEMLNIRQREQAPVIHGIGDIFLDAATEFRSTYPNYVSHLPNAEKRIKEEAEQNAEFRRFLEQCARHPDAHRLDLKHFLNRPSEHLQKYPVTLEAICNETDGDNPDVDFLKEAIEAIKKLQGFVQLWTFQTSMGKGPAGKLEWHNLVPEEVRKSLPKKEAKRQNIIFELIKGEMDYVRDLENIEVMYVAPLREMDPPIIPRDRLPQFINDVFHNYAELHAHHRKMLNAFQEIQREEHPVIRSITAAVYDAVLNFREAYMEYIPNYPIAAYRIDDEMANNPAFKSFVESCTRHPDAHRLDMKNFINRPIPRLLRYELLLKNILDETPEGHEDRETIPQVLELIKALGKETEPGVVSAKQKVEVWRYNSNLVFKSGETIDMDLLNENRSLIHAGKLLRQPDTGFEWNGWTELFVLLFDNYLVMTKPKEKDGQMKYHVYRRPIPLDLLTLANFTDPPTQRSSSILRTRLRGGEKHDPSTPNGGYTNSPESATDSRVVYPCTIHHNGRLGGLYTVFAESQKARDEWKAKLEEAIGLRKVVQESNKVFEVETLSADTFLAPSPLSNVAPQSYSHENAFTGKVTCSVPFTTADGRGLVAIGCAEGVWIGFRHDSRSMRRVLHLKMVTQCAMLEEFGIFLVLADKSLFAYHIEALVPSSPQSAHTSQTPQKLSGSKDVHFFSVGNLNNRTLVIYMKKKGLDSVFRVLEPVLGKINERAKAPQTFGSRLGLRSQRSDWFRVYRDFFLPSESFDLIFLKAKIVILCTKGFEIMDLVDFKSVTIPQRDDPRLEKLAKRCESCRPKGMFRSSKDEFLLCYDEFGLYVDRHGDPSRQVQTIEWEGTAEHVAWHPPYVLLFDQRFIEIRHVETGRLAQIIPGNDVRCIWDGRGTTSLPPASPGADGWNETISQEPRVHGVMNAPESALTPGQPRQARPVVQHVFELIPTIPLYLPGSLSSPTQSTYFAQSNSPPHSPVLNPAYAHHYR